jgi:hypothetical protein
MIPIDSHNQKESEKKIKTYREQVRKWLIKESSFLKSGMPLDYSNREGNPALWSDLKRLMVEQDLWDLEEAFASQYVSNPNSGEVVKGHRIVLAELGLAAFEGKLIRKQDTFTGFWGKKQRQKHILFRLAFIQELFSQSDINKVVLYRGFSTEKPLEKRKNRSFISATFSLEVAKSHFEGLDITHTGMLIRQSVPVERLFMTYLETAQMNQHFKEAEAILLDVDKNTNRQLL